MTVRGTQSPREYRSNDLRLAIIAGIIWPLGFGLLGMVIAQLPDWLWILFQ